MFRGASVVPYFWVSLFNSWHVHADPGTASSASGPIGRGVDGPSGVTKQTIHHQGIQLLSLLMWRVPTLSVNKTLWERIFGRGRTTGMILWTCLFAAKELSSYLTIQTRQILYSTCLLNHTAYTVCPNPHQKQCHFMTMFENMHIFNADMPGTKLQHRT